jgi:hypothetical protein
VVQLAAIDRQGQLLDFIRLGAQGAADAAGDQHGQHRAGGQGAANSTSMKAWKPWAVERPWSTRLGSCFPAGR